MGLILPEHYDPRLSVRETQEAIKYIRDTFQKEFGKEMNLERISAPLFVEKSSGLNDDQTGTVRYRRRSGRDNRSCTFPCKMETYGIIQIWIPAG